MLPDLRYRHEWTRFLEQEMPEQLHNYLDALNGGYALAAHHATVRIQCRVYADRLAAMLADPRWATFVASAPHWTPTAIAGVKSSLAAIAADAETPAAITTLRRELSLD